MLRAEARPTMPMGDEATSTAPQELRAIRVAITVSVIGAVAKLIAGMVTGSMSMISSAIDSLGDLLVSLVNLVVIRVSDSPPDDDHNYGHAKIEGLGAMFEGGFIFAAGTFILYESGHKLWIGEESHDSMVGIYTMLPILAMTVAAVLYLRKVAKETGSLVVKSDALHYLTDVWVNVGVLVSLALVKVTGHAWIDPAISMGIAVYMLYSASHIVQEGFHVVMDRSLDAATVAKVKAMLESTPSIESFHDFKTRAGKIPHVDFHIVVQPEMTTKEVHDLYLHLQARVREIVGPSAKVLMHADPLGG
jgi:ferrous-iron efflux pump FieF